MKIVAKTNSSSALLGVINTKMNKRGNVLQDGQLKTWEIVLSTDNDILYNHTPEQWSLKAVIHPVATASGVEFRVDWPIEKDVPNEETQGYYLGRFVEILMVHFKYEFEYLIIN